MSRKSALERDARRNTPQPAPVAALLANPAQRHTHSASQLPPRAATPRDAHAHNTLINFQTFLLRKTQNLQIA